MNVDSKFQQLFIGNPLAVGAEDGGAIRGDTRAAGWHNEGVIGTEAVMTIDEQWWESQINAHLEVGGGYARGVYPVVAGRCKWGCIDWDEGEGDVVHAVNTQSVLLSFGVTSWIERSRSKGFHLWVFLDSWVDMAPLRKALLVACEIAAAPTKEINPKQFTLDPSKLGNYVRLPYPGRGHRYPQRTIIDLETREERSLPFIEFVDLAWATRNNPSLLEPLSQMWVEPPPVFAPTFVADDRDMFKRLDAYVYVIFRDGPLDGADKSATLWKLACKIAEGGKHTRDECIQILVDADERWGKFSDRDDGLVQLTRLVDKAWGTK